MKKKSIMFFGWYFYPKIGGAETILLNQARELVARGYNVSVITSVLDDGVENEEDIFGIKVIRRKYIDSRMAQDEKLISCDLSEIIGRVKPDIFHFHNGSYPSGGKDKSIGVKTILAIFDTITKFNIPIIEHAHNAQLRDYLATKPLRDLPWSYLICVSDFVRQEWQKLGTNAAKIKVIHNGIDTELFSKAVANDKMKKIRSKNDVILFSPARLFSLTTGKLNKQKNMSLVFDALEELVEKNIHNFVLVSIFNDVYGSDVVKSAKQLIDRIIKDKKLDEKIVLIPIIDPNDMPGFYAGVDIVCVPAYHETFGMMYLEAMAAGKVVIASNTGGPKEYIRNRENGFFVDPTDSKELAALLLELMQNESLRKKIGKTAALDAKKFSISAMIDELEKIYKELSSNA